jgi:hypothetical protein
MTVTRIALLHVQSAAEEKDICYLETKYRKY